jgi:hypothetical protein
MIRTNKLGRRNVKAGVVHALPLLTAAPNAFGADTDHRDLARLDVAAAHQGGLDCGALFDVDPAGLAAACSREGSHQNDSAEEEQIDALFACLEREVNGSDGRDNHERDVVPLSKNSSLVGTDLQCQPTRQSRCFVDAQTSSPCWPCHHS